MVVTHLRETRSRMARASRPALGKAVKSWPHTWQGRYSTQSGHGFFAPTGSRFGCAGSTRFSADNTLNTVDSETNTLSRRDPLVGQFPVGTVDLTPLVEDVDYGLTFPSQDAMQSPLRARSSIGEIRTPATITTPPASSVIVEFEDPTGTCHRPTPTSGIVNQVQQAGLDLSGNTSRDRAGLQPQDSFPR